MENLKLCMMSENEKREYNLSLNDNYYMYKCSEKIIGFAKINADKEQGIWIFINPEMRSNGYGTKLFGEVLYVLKNLNIDSVEIETSTKNVTMMRILEHYNSRELTRIKGIVRYVVPVNM